MSTPSATDFAADPPPSLRPHWLWFMRGTTLLSFIASVSDLVAAGGLADPVAASVMFSLPYACVLLALKSRNHAAEALGFMAGWNGMFLVVTGLYFVRTNLSMGAVLFCLAQVFGIMAALGGLVLLRKRWMPILRFVAGVISAIFLWPPFIMGLGEAFGSSP